MVGSKVIEALQCLIIDGDAMGTFYFHYFFYGRRLYERLGIFRRKEAFIELCSSWWVEEGQMLANEAGTSPANKGQTKRHYAAELSTLNVRVSLMIRASLFWLPPSHPDSSSRAVMVVSLCCVRASLANFSPSLLPSFSEFMIERLYEPPRFS